MEVLPLLFLGRAYLESDTQNFFLYTNMVWAFFTAVVIQCLVSIQGLAGGGRLDTFLHSEGSVIPWLSGYTGGVCVTSFCVCFGVRFRVPGGCVEDAGLCAARCSHLTRLCVFGVWI